MMSTMKAAGRAAATMMAWVTARLGIPAFVTVAAVTILVLAFAFWVIADDERSDRVTRMIYARYGDARCLASNARRSSRRRLTHPPPRKAQRRARGATGAGTPSPRRVVQ
jgi:hypothetical protein